MAAATTSGGPYKGLAAYTEADAEFFFGRESERQIVVANLRAWRLTLVYGASGVGKSSLLRAGVTQRLRELARRNATSRRAPKIVPVVFASWRDDPAEELVDACAAAAAELGLDVARPRGGQLREAIAAMSEAADATFLVVLDQFEEYFLYHRAGDGRGTFAAEFADAVNAPRLRVNFLVSIREDALAWLDRFRPTIPSLFDNYLRIEHLDEDAARAAIEKPIDRYNERAPKRRVSIEPRLVDAVIAQLQGGDVSLAGDPAGAVNGAAVGIETPYLQLVMSRLWAEEAEASSPTLRRQTLDRLGGAERIVRTHLDKAMAALSPEDQAAAAGVFRHLVTPSGTKIAYSASDLAEYSERPEPEVESVLVKLSQPDVRILRPVDPAPGRPANPRYEIFHDVLAAAVLDWRRRRQAAELERQKREAEVRADHERTRARVFQALAIGAAALLVVAVAAAVVVLKQRQTLTREKRAGLSRELAADARLTLGSRFDLGGLLAVQAYRTAPTFDAKSALIAAVDRSAGLERLLRSRRGIYDVAFSPRRHLIATAGLDKAITIWDAKREKRVRTLRGDTGAVQDVAFSPNGRLLASASEDKTVRLWRVADGRQLARFRRRGTQWAVAFSSDGRFLAAGGSDHAIAIWATRSRRRVRTFPTGTTVWTLAFEPGAGDLLASGEGKTNGAGFNDDGYISLWRIDTRRALAHWYAQVDDVYDVAFIPHTEELASANSDGTVSVWDARTARAPSDRWMYDLDSNSGQTVLGLGVSRDGKALASGGSDGIVHVWNLPQSASFEDGEPLTPPLRVHGDWVESLAFSPDGKTLVAGSLDGEASIWNLAKAGRGGRTTTQSDDIADLAFSGDGRLLASATPDGPIVIRKPQDARRFGKPLPGGGTALAFNPSGVLAAANGKNVVLWDARTRRRITRLQAGAKNVSDVAFSRDGRMLAAASRDHVIRFWSVHGRSYRRVGKPLRRGSPAFTVAFSPRGHLVAAGYRDGAIVLWDARTFRRVGRLRGNTADVDDLAFSPDGTLLASGAVNNIVVLWNVRRRRKVATLTGHKDSVISVAFSPDGRGLASGSSDSTVIVWDVATHRSVGEPLDAPSDVNATAFSRDGRTLAVASDNGSLTLWDTAPWRPGLGVRRLCRVIGRNLTAGEWKQFVGGARRRTC